jgi:hypothetical protein
MKPTPQLALALIASAALLAACGKKNEAPAVAEPSAESAVCG